MKFRITILFAIFFIAVKAQSPDLKLLSGYMAGTYSSEEQHLKDTADYFDIRLEIIPIWKNRTDGYWFYVEQAVAQSIDKPYRQRVYHLTELNSGKFSSVVYTMNDPSRFTHQAELLEKLLSPDSLIEREGCAVILMKDGKDKFVGSTEDKKCPSERSGATYAVSEVTIYPNELHSWDRGFDGEDKQVWGATKGGYIFIKK